MAAAGREGIPCTFVVDRVGKIAYIGHPMYLPVVLPRVVAGDATADQVGAAAGTIEAEFNDVSGRLSRDPKSGLQSLKGFEAKYPPLLDFLPSYRAKLSYLPKHGAVGEAKIYADAFVAKSVEKGDVLGLRVAASILRRGDGKEYPELLAIAVKAAEAVVKIDGGNVAESLMNLADAHFVNGDKARAKEYARKAVDAASGETADFKSYIMKEAARLSGE